MSMTAQEQKEVRAYCAFLLTEYGIHLPPDDPVIPALYIMYRHTKSNSESNHTLADQIHEALKKLQPQEFHFHHPGEAWKFQMATAFKWMLISVLVLVFLLIGTWHWSRVNDVAKAKLIIQSSGDMGKLFHRVQIDNKGIYFIDFIVSSGDSTKHFIEYERIDKKTIRVYVGKASGSVQY